MANRAAQYAAIASGFLLYAALVGVLWYIAYNQQDDKSRAALIGAASALTAGLAAVGGSWFTAWRTSQTHRLTEIRTVRRTHYANVLGLLSTYDTYRKQAHGWYEKSGQAGLSDTARNKSAERSVAAFEQADEMRPQIAAALGAADLVAGPEVRTAVAALREAIDSMPSSPDQPVVETPWVPFHDAVRIELGDVPLGREMTAQASVQDTGTHN